MKKKIIITDLDGTAVDSPGQKLASPRLKQAIANLVERYYICAATGRSWTFAKNLLTDLQLNDPCIISGGTRICLPRTGEIVWQQNIEAQDVASIWQIMRDHPQYKVLCNDYSEEDYLSERFSVQDLVLPKEVYFLEETFVPEQEAVVLQEKLSRLPNVTCTMVVAQRAGHRDLHITHALATKEHAIAVLLEKLGMRRADAVGIGDGHNDLHLFAGVGYKVAMGNAVPSLQAQADLVIGDVKDDGLAKYLESFA